jgi:hypothetical protein
MKQFNSQELLQNLQLQVKEIINQTVHLKKYSKEVLQKKPNATNWSVGEILEHLNFYCQFYLPVIEQKLHLHQTTAAPNFKSGLLGNYFTNSMLPNKEQQIANKMKTFKAANPPQHNNAIESLNIFINHQHQLLNLLHIAQMANLNSIKIPTSLSKLIQLKLGDVFRFLIAHQQRHFIQIQHTLSRL